MPLDQTVRVVHRWVSILFTLGVIANILAMQAGPPPAWVGLLALGPLIVLLLTGLYLFALPYLVRRRRGGVAS